MKRAVAWTRVAALLALMGASASAEAQSVRYYHLDALGSVRALTDASGTVLERHDYLPFGEECTTGPCALNQGVGVGGSRKFTGKERDTETGLDYFGARYYGSKIARFTTVDPYLDQQAALADPQRWNRYAYALNSPLRNIDPDGRDAIDLVIGFGQGIGNAAVGVVTTPIALVTNPRAVISGIGQDLRLLGYGLANPGEVADIYVQLAVSSNDADQRALGAAFGQGTATAALVLAPTAKGTPATATTGPKPGSAGGPGAGKRFSNVTKDAARAESPSCVFCETPTARGLGPTQSNIDHAIPKSRGGNNTLANAQNTCRNCNLTKGTKTTEEFLKQ